MDAHDFISRIRAAGFTIALVDGSLAISPASNLNAERRSWIRTHKAALAEALRQPGRLLDADGGHDFAPANDASSGQDHDQHLPPRLVSAATRVCRSIHGDDDDGVQAMLDDLVVHPPESWNALAEHFEGQLPPPPEPGYERIPMEAAGYAFEVDVPEQQAPAARASLRFRLHNGDGGSLLGAPGTTAEELREVLVAKYAGRLESINEQPLP